MMGLLFFLGILFLASILFKYLNQRKSLHEGFIDLLIYCADQFGIRRSVDMRFLLSYEEGLKWMEILADHLIIPYLSNLYFDSNNDVLVIAISHAGWKTSFDQKSVLDQKHVISQSLVHYVRKSRGYQLPRQMIFYNVWQSDYFELWIPLSDRGMRVISELRRQRRK